jgi:hypothetical protein
MYDIIDELGIFFPIILVATLFFIANKLGDIPGDVKEKKRKLEKAKFFENPSAISIHHILDNYHIRPREDAPLPIEIRPKVFSRTNGLCHYCKKDLKINNIWQIEHVWPKRFGGTDELLNLVPSCVDCNENKWAYIPPFYLFRKWVLAIPFTQFEKNFIDYHRKISMSYLTSNAHLKSCCDWWLATKYQEFADLILNSPGILSLPIKERKKQIQIAQELFNDMELGKIANPGYGFRYSSYRAIEKIIEDSKF